MPGRKSETRSPKRLQEPPPGNAEPQLGVGPVDSPSWGLAFRALMKPTSESLSPSGTWNRRVAECYCGAAMCRGELREAKDQPQTKVNSIRPGRLASRRRGGMRPRGWVPCEACGLGHTRSSDIARHLLTGGDVRVGGVRMVRRLHGPSLDRADAPRPSEGGTTPGNGTRSSTRSFPRRLWRWRLHR